MRKIHKIVLTGGPCAGKSTAISFMRTFFAGDYNVYTVPETATELMSNGINITDFEDINEYQRCQMKLHKEQEEAFMYAARNNVFNEKDALVVCDRGQFDCRAYMDPEEFDNVLLSVYDDADSVDEIFNSYDAVFHLATSAIGAEFSYSLESNKVRSESPEEAIALDNRLVYAWKDHPHYVYIPSYENFTEKITHLRNAIAEFLEEQPE